ncbi:MAG: BMP family ABC transporter substrate-binding protein [Firmicutes bacterium]|nr:BMP family ABC transporter substrate-binding protein [Bacillota bacterium]
MKKLLALLLALAMVFSMAACTSSNEPAAEPTPAEGEGEGETAAEFSVAMITDYGDITDESFNQATYEACKAFSDANGIKFNYYKPAGDSTAERVAMIDAAVADGFNVIVCPGYAFGEALAESSATYPDVKFIALDVSEFDLGLDTVPDNLFSAVYQEELCDFMAGYAAVALGYKHLGYLGGMAVPSVVRFGNGYIQGADLAAKELGKEGVTIEYVYGNQFFGDADITSYMDTWYQTNGVEVVFACGGGIWTSAAEAAAKVGGKVIGVDVDQSKTIDAYGAGMTVTSAMKGLKATVNTLLTELILNDNWSAYGGQVMTLGLVSGTDVEANYTQIPYDTTQWGEGFTQEDYVALVGRMFSGEISVDGSQDEFVPSTITLNRYDNIK